MTTLRRLLSLTCQSLVLLVVLDFTAVVGLVVWSMYRYDIRLLGVQSQSMAPVLNIGDAVIIRPTIFETLRTGDIVTYRLQPGAAEITHRIAIINAQTKRFVAQGDANTDPDGELSAAMVSGKVIAVAPHLGQVITLMRTPAGLIGLVYLPATALIVWEVRRLQVAWRRPYRASGYYGR